MKYCVCRMFYEVVSDWRKKYEPKCPIFTLFSSATVGDPWVGHCNQPTDSESPIACTGLIACLYRPGMGVYTLLYQTLTTIDWPLSTRCVFGLMIVDDCRQGRLLSTPMLSTNTF